MFEAYALLTVFVGTHIRAEAIETLGRLPCHIGRIRWFHNGQILRCLPIHDIAESGPIRWRYRRCLGLEYLVHGISIPRIIVGILFGLVVIREPPLIILIFSVVVSADWSLAYGFEDLYRLRAAEVLFIYVFGPVLCGKCARICTLIRPATNLLAQMKIIPGEDLGAIFRRKAVLLAREL